MIHSVVQVKPRHDFKVYVYFDDGKIKLFDVSDLIKKGVFKQISDIDFFIDRCTVMNGTLAWDIGGNFDEYNCLDIDPETVYEQGETVTDPLGQTA